MSSPLDDWMREAYGHHQAGAFERAEALYRRILEKQPDNVDALYLLGEIALRTGRSAQAFGALRKAVDLDGSVSVFHYSLGQALQAEGRLEEALASYQKAIELDPECAPAHNDLGALLRARGHTPEARKCFERALEIDPNLAPANANLAAVLAAARDLEGAIHRYRLALRSDPQWLEAQMELADALARAARFAELGPTYREIMRLKRAAAARLPARPAQPRPKVRIAETTLCCIDCQYHDLAISAMQRCLSGCEFERALFLTDRDMAIEGIEVVAIRPIASIAEYCRFVVKELNQYISTPFALIVQYDGFILNPAKWTEAFKQYDYIGARWEAQGSHNVGNGGFSLRSKRLLEALQDERIAQFVPEDRVICDRYRELLERDYGIRFAPGELADRFSFEEARVHASSTFGFHGLGHAIHLVDMAERDLHGYVSDCVVAAIDAPGDRPL